MPKLMTIKEAAEYLNVSEMSLRRWTNSGKLKCLRIGKKNERRFKKEDLIAYLSEEPQTVPTSLDLPEDAHVAHFYKSDREGLNISLNAIKDGLDNGEIVVAVVPSQKGKLLRKQLKSRGILVDILETQQILTIFSGCKTPEAQIYFVDQLIKRAQSFNGFRLVGDMEWARQQNWNMKMIHRLEEMTNRQRENIPAKYICQYKLDTFSQDETFLVMQTHNFTFYNGKLNPCPYSDLASKWAPAS